MPPRKNPLPTYDQLAQRLWYEPETGDFYYRVDAGRARKGKLAGKTDHEGYRKLRYMRSEFKAHCAAWLLMTGEWPPLPVDHINRKRGDNRWVNLRLATMSQQQGNATKAARGKSGVRGVVKTASGKFLAQFRVRRDESGRRSGFSKTFATLEEARAAYEAAAREFYGEFYGEAQ